MEKKIVVCIGTDRDRNVRARLSLLLMDGAQEIHEHYHSVNISPTDDLAQIRAVTEKHLSLPKSASSIPFAPWPAIPDEEWSKVERVCKLLQSERGK